MATHGNSKSAAIRARLNHPVVDADGHWIEYEPVLVEYLRQTMGPRAAERVIPAMIDVQRRYYGADPTMSFEQRQGVKMAQHAWWFLPSGNTLDRATAMMPKLLHERLGEMGLDFCVLFPTMLATVPVFEDEELRRGACHAFNTYTAELFRDYNYRLTPVACIPMHTPREAIEELEHAKALGLKAVMLSGLVSRHIPESSGHETWRDPLALDSGYDYDPVWAKCLELRLAPTFHASSQGIGLRNSPSNWVYNHIGHFGAAGEALCKALFLGGVTRRFPKLKVAFMEGGAGWAVSLYSDLIRHWETRSAQAIGLTDPARLDRETMLELIGRYGEQRLRDQVRRENLQIRNVPPPPNLDDFSRCGIHSAEDVRDLFVPNFYFGCEAEDPTNLAAFNTKVNPMGSRLNAMLGSDFGHFDVKDMTGVLAEAWELVEQGVLNEAELRDFTFTNPARFFAGMNPDFFKGTAVEKPVADLVAATPG
ncbi:MAG: amidohydrolase family protein [Candidatus Binataceae bacterium]